MINNKFRKEGIEKIWLIDMGDDIVWCNESDPSGHVEEEDATGYVRMDIHQALEKENAELKVRLIKGQESFELVLDNTASDKTTINTLFEALKLAKPYLWKANMPSDEWVIICGAITSGLAKQHKQG